eukprot:PhM_4_TR15706/c0_g1_i1/m.84952
MASFAVWVCFLVCGVAATFRDYEVSRLGPQVHQSTVSDNSLTLTLSTAGDFPSIKIPAYMSGMVGMTLRYNLTHARDNTATQAILRFISTNQSFDVVHGSHSQVDVLPLSETSDGGFFIGTGAATSGSAIKYASYSGLAKPGIFSESRQYTIDIDTSSEVTVRRYTKTGIETSTTLQLQNLVAMRFTLEFYLYGISTTHKAIFSNLMYEDHSPTTAIRSGTRYPPGYTFYTSNTRLIIQEDGNMVHYYYYNSTVRKVLWASNTDGKCISGLVIRSGVFVLPNCTGTLIHWSSEGIYGNEGVYGLVTDSCLLLKDQNGKTIWSSDSSCTVDTASPNTQKPSPTAAVGPPCYSMLTKTACSNSSIIKDSSCVWNGTACEARCDGRTSSTCPQAYCTWSNLGCGRGYSVACGFGANTTCIDAGCVWDQGLELCSFESYGRCAFKEEYACKHHNLVCQWTASKCSPIPTPAPPTPPPSTGCTAYTSESKCDAVDLCTWHTSASRCIIRKQDVPPCRYGDSAACNEASQCFWDSQRMRCLFDVKPETCTSHTAAYVCNAAPSCALTGNGTKSCSNRQELTCTARTSCRQVSSCSMYNAMQVPCDVSGSCLWDGAACVDRVSAIACPYQSSSTCKSVTGCKYSSTSNTCSADSSGKPNSVLDPVACFMLPGYWWNSSSVSCETSKYNPPVANCAYGSSVMCNADAGCQYSSGSCSPAPADKVQCSDVKFEVTCRTRAGCQWIQGKCSNQTTTRPCLTPTESSLCGWNNVSLVFEPKSTRYACPTVTDVATCVSTLGCGWNHVQKKCQYSSLAVPCSYPTETQCASTTGCTWISGKCVVNRDLKTICGYADISACASVEGCDWSAVRNSCGPYPRTSCGFGQSSACTSVVGCVWTASDSTCRVFNATNRPCGFSERLTCNSVKGCAWTNGGCELTRVAVTCGYGDPHACDTQAGCAWNTSINVCETSTSSSTGSSSNQTTTFNLCSADEAATCELTLGCQWSNNACVKRVATKMPCPFQSADGCSSAIGCKWTVPSGPCEVDYNIDPVCGFDGAACNFVPGCAWNVKTERCELSGHDSIPCVYAQKSACESIAGCRWRSQSSKCETAESIVCSYDDRAACLQDKMCAWNTAGDHCTYSSVGSCTRRIEKTCATKDCYYDLWVCEAVRTWCNASSASDISVACGRYASCKYDSSENACTSLGEDCGVFDNKLQCERSFCQWSGSACKVHSAVSEVFKYPISQCSNNTDPSECFDSGQTCYWNMHMNRCRDVNSLPKEIQPLSGLRVIPLEPQPDTSFRVEAYGRAMSTSDYIMFIGVGSKCPSALVEYQRDGETFATYDSTRSLYTASNIKKSTGRYIMCVFLQQANAAVTIDEYLQVRKTPPTTTSIVLNPSPPYGNVSFIVTLLGKNFHTNNYFALVSDTSSCPSISDSKFLTSYSRVEGLTSDYNKVSATRTLPVGRYYICLTDGFSVSKLTQFPINIPTLAPWLDVVEQANAIDAFKNEDVVLGDRTIKFSEFKGRNWCTQQENMIMLSPYATTFMFGDLSSQYKSSQTCWYFIQPLKQKYATVDLKLVNIDNGDGVYIFLPSDSGPFSCDIIGTEEVCIKRGCEFRNQKCQKFTGRPNPNCPVAIGGFELYAKFDYINFAQVAGSTRSHQAQIPLSSPESKHPSTGIIVVCTSSTRPSGSGVLASYRGSEEGHCPNNCEVDGVKRGTCVLDSLASEYYCQCQTGYSGVNCAQQTTCSGTTRLTEVSGSFTSRVAAVSPCAYIIDPDITTDLTLERMHKRGVVIQLTNVNLQNAEFTTACEKGAGQIKIRDGESSSGTVLQELCGTTTQSTILYTTQQVAFVEVIPISTKMEFTVSYKVISYVCPGPLQGDDIYPTNPCDGHGTCWQLEPTVWSDVTHYRTQCRCTAEFKSPKPSSSCTECAFGYREDSYPSCISVSMCLSDAECNGGVCLSSQCSCKPDYFGSRCQEYVPSSVVIERKELLEYRFSFDSSTAANSAIGSGDSTILPCALPGSKFDCVPVVRRRGKLYGVGSAGNITKTSTATSFARKLLQTVTPTSTMLSTSTPEPTHVNVKTADEGLHFNKIVGANVYRDLVRVMPVRHSDLDIEREFTITSWVKMTDTVDGFLVAKVDAIFTSSGVSPILENAMFDVQDRGIGESDLRLGLDGAQVYFAIHISGSRRQITVLMSKGERDGGRDNWLVVRHFRLTNNLLFDDSWRYLAIMVGHSRGRFEAQLFIDGFSEPSSPVYSQCLPFVPTKVDDPPANFGANTNETLLINPGGAMLFGYHFQGALDEVRVYTRRLDPFIIVSIGGDEFSSQLEVNRAALYGVAYVGLSVLIIVMFIPLLRRARSFFNLNSKLGQAMEDAEREYDNYLKEKKKKRREIRLRLQRERRVEAEKMRQEQLARMDEDVVKPVNAGDTADVEPVRTDEKADSASDQQQNESPENAVIPLEHDVPVPGAIDESETAEARAAREEKEEEQKAIDRNAHLSNKDKFLKNASAAAPTGAQSISKTAGTATDAAVTSDQVQNSDQSSLQRLLMTLGDIFNVSKDGAEYVLRISLARDAWQFITLYFYCFTFPREFTDAFGTVTSAISFDWSLVYQVDVTITFYIGMSISWAAFVVLVFVAFTEKPIPPSDIRRQREEDDRIRDEKEAQGESYSKKRSTREKITWVSLFVLNTLYLPVTKNSIEIMSCHTNVQCAFDCYNDSRFWTAFVFAIVTLCTVTLGSPLIMLYLIFLKENEFINYLAVVGDKQDIRKYTVKYRNFPSRFIRNIVGDSDVDIPIRAQQSIEWKKFLPGDYAAYNSLYNGYEFEYRYFVVALMAVKVIMCIPILTLPPDSTSQLACVLVIQATFTVTVFASSPFLMDSCDYVMCIGQFYVLFSLMLSAFYRADPMWGGWGVLMNSTAIIAFILQAYHIVMDKVQFVKCW